MLKPNYDLFSFGVYFLLSCWVFWPVVLTPPGACERPAGLICNGKTLSALALSAVSVDKKSIICIKWVYIITYQQCTYRNNQAPLNEITKPIVKHVTVSTTL